MLTSNRRRDPLPDVPRSKMTGFVLLFLGVFSLTVSGLVLAIPESFYGNTGVKYFFGAATGVWGLFRVITGIRTIQKASAYEKQIVLEGTLPDAETHETKSE